MGSLFTVIPSSLGFLALDSIFQMSLLASISQKHFIVIFRAWSFARSLHKGLLNPGVGVGHRDWGSEPTARDQT